MLFRSCLNVLESDVSLLCKSSTEPRLDIDISFDISWKQTGVRARVDVRESALQVSRSSGVRGLPAKKMMVGWWLVSASPLDKPQNPTTKQKHRGISTPTLSASRHSLSSSPELSSTNTTSSRISMSRFQWTSHFQ